MTITFEIDDFLYNIFPGIAGGGTHALAAKLADYYSIGPHKPAVSIVDNKVTIEIDLPAVLQQESQFKKAVALCEKGKYTEAKKLLSELIQKNPSFSEYHRIYGQILSDEGDQEEAVNSLIDALRWNPENGYALIMMGNIYAKFKKDIPTAMSFYDKALKVNPSDYIVSTNIGSLLHQQGRSEEAKKYLRKALDINPAYPNTHALMSLIAEAEGDLSSAFYSVIESIKLNKSKDALVQNSLKNAFDLAGRIVQEGNGKQIVKGFLHKLEFEGGREIETIEDSSITSAAKIEFAEYYGREKHTIKFKPDYPAVEHLMMHELLHLALVIEARAEDANLVFTSTQEHRSAFLKSISFPLQKLRDKGISAPAADQYAAGLFDGLNLQAYNAPIDLFIENRMHRDHAELRAYQFLSLYALIRQGVKAVTDPKITALSPKNIVSKSKIYSLTGAMQFKDLYGIDLVQEFKPDTMELKQAKDFYNEYLEAKDAKKPAQEYELVLHWAEELKLDGYFELIHERELQKRTHTDELLESITQDPYDLDSKDPYKQREMERFQKSQESAGVNMAVVMFMVDALQYFDGIPKEEIKKIAFEIAMRGTQGYSPAQKDYRIHSIPDKTFSGFHILAYYYVSWMIAIPEMVPQLH
ncbi:tetratricopeptide repeat protein, partial [bacterium]|nr:tetratricopeptide repeat protein [bacterium]